MREKKNSYAEASVPEIELKLRALKPSKANVARVAACLKDVSDPDVRRKMMEFVLFPASLSDEASPSDRAKAFYSSGETQLPSEMADVLFRRLDGSGKVSFLGACPVRERARLCARLLAGEQSISEEILHIFSRISLPVLGKRLLREILRLASSPDPDPERQILLYISPVFFPEKTETGECENHPEAKRYTRAGRLVESLSSSPCFRKDAARMLVEALLSTKNPPWANLGSMMAEGRVEDAARRRIIDEAVERREWSFFQSALSDDEKDPYLPGAILENDLGEAEARTIARALSCVSPAFAAGDGRETVLSLARKLARPRPSLEWADSWNTALAATNCPLEEAGILIAESAADLCVEGELQWEAGRHFASLIAANASGRVRAVADAFCGRVFDHLFGTESDPEKLSKYKPSRADRLMILKGLVDVLEKRGSAGWAGKEPNGPLWSVLVGEGRGGRGEFSMLKERFIELVAARASGACGCEVEECVPVL